MNSITVYQFDSAGMFLHVSVADESPLEPGVFHMPRGTVTVAPPEEVPDDLWPRWDGAAWQLVPRPVPVPEPTPVEKLAAFLQENPDVAALITPPTA